MKEDVIKVLKVKPHEHPEVYMLKNTLEAMQEAVGGYIDILGLDDNVCILLNDEGKLIGLEGNRRIGSDISYRKEVRRRSRFCEAKILTMGAIFLWQWLEKKFNSIDLKKYSVELLLWMLRNVDLLLRKSNNTTI